MRTAFSQERMDFTRRAHAAARQQFYPLMFPGCVTFEDTVNTTRDLDYAIDCQLAVCVDGLRGPIRFAIQERFRQPQEIHWGDITVTEWNLASNEPSELHKLGAQLFVYGFYDSDTDQICLAVAVDVGLMQWALAHDEIKYERRRRGDQSFLGFKFYALREIGAVLFVHDQRAQEGVA